MANKTATTVLGITLTGADERGEWMKENWCPLRPSDELTEGDQLSKIAEDYFFSAFGFSSFGFSVVGLSFFSAPSPAKVAALNERPITSASMIIIAFFILYVTSLLFVVSPLP